MDAINRFKIGARLAQLRKEKNMSQETLAEISGVARRTITNIENGSFAVKIDTLWKLADALGCKIKIVDKAE